MCTPEDLEKINEIKDTINKIEDQIDTLIEDTEFKRAVNGNDSVEVQSIKDRQEVLFSMLAIYERKLRGLEKKCNNSTPDCPKVMRSYIYGY